MATVFSHLAGGDVALNITVTAVNSVLAVVTLPVVVALSVAYFVARRRWSGCRPTSWSRWRSLRTGPGA